jgi:hypothetical protein
MEPVSAKSVDAMDCSLAAMNKSSIDQPSTLLLQSLKRVCSAAEGTGLTAKEAVAKLQEQGLPGLIIEGGERLIVQVAKSFRSSSAFVEREERGRYFITQESTDLDDWDKVFQTADSTTEREEATAEELSSADADFETVIEAAKQLQKLQEPIEADLADKSGTNRWVLALRGKSMTGHTRKVEAPISPQKASSDQSAPRCNRDDGKGWRCVRVAESGFSLCKYHRDQIRRAEIRRRKARSKSKKQQSRVQPAVKPSNPTVSKGVRTVEAEGTVDDGEARIDSDNELPEHMRRGFDKAKSLKALLRATGLDL